MCNSGIKSVVIHVWTWIFDLSKMGLFCSLLLLPGISLHQSLILLPGTIQYLQRPPEKKVTRAQKEEENNICQGWDILSNFTPALALPAFPFSNFWNQSRNHKFCTSSPSIKKEPKGRVPLTDLKLRIINILSILPMTCLEKSLQWNTFI